MIKIYPYGEVPPEGILSRREELPDVSGPVAEKGGVALWFRVTGAAVSVICVAVLAILPRLPEKKERLDAEA